MHIKWESKVLLYNIDYLLFRWYLQDFLDYEFDSDEEWEEPGESLSDSEVRTMISLLIIHSPINVGN